MFVIPTALKCTADAYTPIKLDKRDSMHVVVTLPERFPPILCHISLILGRIFSWIFAHCSYSGSLSLPCLVAAHSQEGTTRTLSVKGQGQAIIHLTRHSKTGVRHCRAHLKQGRVRNLHGIFDVVSNCEVFDGIVCVIGILAVQTRHIRRSAGCACVVLNVSM